MSQEQLNFHRSRNRPEQIFRTPFLPEHLQVTASDTHKFFFHTSFTLHYRQYSFPRLIVNTVSAEL